MPPHRVRFLVAAAAVVSLAGCPSSNDPSLNNGEDAGVDAGGESCTAVPSCTATIQFKSAAAEVSLRGDFAADGWTAGIAMTKTGDTFEATVPVTDNQVILYKFVVDGNWVPDPENPRRSPDGFGMFNSVLRADCDQCPARTAIDWRDAVMYFVLIDRFADGDATNNAPVAGVEMPGQYQGGDFAGVTQKIEAGYFAELGINTLWITSPLDNADNANPGTDGHMYSGYHGYWPRDLEAAETKLGTEAELELLVDTAHAHGIQVLIDYVMNHVHTQSPTYQQHPEWFWPNDNGNGGNCVCGGDCDWGNDRLRCWFDNFLPDFDFRNADARRWSVNNAIAWAKRLGVDGFRLDAVKHIETQWLVDLRGRANGELAFDQQFYMVGETFDGDRGIIKSYVNPNTMLDGQFDFPLRGNVLEKIVRRDGTMGDLVSFLDTNDSFYGPGSVMSTFLGNHDVPRTIHTAEDTPMFGAWDGGKWAAWTGQPQLPTSANPFERLMVAYTLLYTIPGIPMIYYGDEWGMPGAGDPDNRRFMQWTGYTANQHKLRDHLAALGKIRNAHPSTRRGTRQTIGVGNDVVVYKMSTTGDAVIVALNRSDTDKDATSLPAGTYVNLVTGATVTAPLTLPPRSAVILAAQ